MKSKLKFIIPLTVLLLLGGVYKFALARPPAEPKKKIHGVVYVLPKEFVVNLEDGHFAKFNVALVLDHSQPTAPAAAGGHSAPVEPPEGFGTLEQEGIIRDIIVDEMTGAESDELVKKKKRAKLKKKLVKHIKSHSDVKVHEVLLTDIAVQ
jgi:flagellar basal body-associated protein FliL